MNEHKNSVQVPAFELPASYYLDAQSLEAQREHSREQAEFGRAIAEQANDKTSETKLTQSQRQQQQAELFYQSATYQRLKTLYPCQLETQDYNGVYTETFTPADGIAQHHQKHVLINLHAGSFESGSRTGSHTESMPVAALGRIKVISVDYRLAPEHRFPAATDDVLAVYQALLKDYKPSQIGIYGSSSGAKLTAQLMVKLQTLNLPLPAAIAMIAGAAHPAEGDSYPMVGAITQGESGFDILTPLRNQAYFEGVDLNQPNAVPGRSDFAMSGFPPSFLATSTRDFALSPVLATQRQLSRLGVSNELHVWDGLNHIFHYNPGLPETRELHEKMLRFFEEYLPNATAC